MALPDPETIADIIRRVAHDVVMPRFGELQDGEITEKRPGDAGNLVTIADLESEKALTAKLQAALPGSVAIGEELIESDPSKIELLKGDRPVWLIDPVDGTSNFAAGKGPFTILVALFQNGETIGGWIYAPLEDRTAYALKGEGAYCNGERMQVAPAVGIDKAFGSAHASAWGREYRDKVRPKFQDFGELINYRCAGYDFLQLASGNKHFSLYRTLLPWDHAAGVLLHAEAGGYLGLVRGGDYVASETVRGVLAAPDLAFWQSVERHLKPI